MIRFALLLCATIWTSVATSGTAFDHLLWDQFVKQNVMVVQGRHTTRVDYAGAARQRLQLERYLDQVASVRRLDFDRWTASEQLALLINTYNAATIELVLSRYPAIRSIKDLGKLWQSPWQRPLVRLLGEKRSLDNVEQELIRASGRYNDPRVHFALNCASIGCPALRPEAYLASRLDQQLEDQARMFLGDRSRNNLSQSTLQISPIFKWYRSDFESGWRGISRLPDFLARYASVLGLTPGQLQCLQGGSIGISYLDYDWRLNASN